MAEKKRKGKHKVKIHHIFDVSSFKNFSIYIASILPFLFYIYFLMHQLLCSAHRQELNRDALQS